MDEATGKILNEIADSTTSQILARGFGKIRELLLAGDGVRVLTSKAEGPGGKPCTTRVSLALEEKSTIAMRLTVTWARCSVERSGRYRWQHVARCWTSQASA